MKNVKINLIVRSLILSFFLTLGLILISNNVNADPRPSEGLPSDYDVIWKWCSEVSEYQIRCYVSSAGECYASWQDLCYGTY